MVTKGLLFELNPNDFSSARCSSSSLERTSSSRETTPPRGLNHMLLRIYSSFWIPFWLHPYLGGDMLSSAPSCSCAVLTSERGSLKLKTCFIPILLKISDKLARQKKKKHCFHDSSRLPPKNIRPGPKTHPKDEKY